jgi:DNA-binding NtrC family response regulator
LQNAIQRYVAVGRLDIPILSLPAPGAPPSGIDTGETASGQGANLKGEIERLERASLKAALERHGGNKSRAAQALGISRKTLFRKLRRYGDL